MFVSIINFSEKNNINVYLGTQRGEGVPDQKHAFCPYLPYHTKQQVVSSLLRTFGSPALGQTLQFSLYISYYMATSAVCQILAQ